MVRTGGPGSLARPVAAWASWFRPDLQPRVVRWSTGHVAGRGSGLSVSSPALTIPKSAPGAHLEAIGVGDGLGGGAVEVGEVADLVPPSSRARVAVAQSSSPKGASHRPGLLFGHKVVDQVGQWWGGVTGRSWVGLQSPEDHVTMALAASRGVESMASMCSGKANMAPSPGPPHEPPLRGRLLGRPDHRVLHVQTPRSSRARVTATR
ncbi:MAG: hypothetical protein Ct9H300mP12_03290 [Acidimicrobiales bacterium]|nr:MAG: hypothetical protein Ct9H300mP12_03290 [Acidimicrobiales bacterium]